MKNFAYVFKNVNGVRTDFVVVGEWSLCLLPYPKPVPVDNLQFVREALANTEPRTMWGAEGKHLSLPFEIHVLAQINDNNTEAEFDIEFVEVDFNTAQMAVVEKYHVHAKQWPDGFVKVDRIV